MKRILSNFHKAFESKVRLGIMSALVVNESVDFNALKELLNVTDGNLASHLKALEKNGFIKVKKKFLGRKPNTTYSLTTKGGKSFKQHIETIEQLILANKTK